MGNLSVVAIEEGMVTCSRWSACTITQADIRFQCIHVLINRAVACTTIIGFTSCLHVRNIKSKVDTGQSHAIIKSEEERQVNYKLQVDQGWLVQIEMGCLSLCIQTTQICQYIYVYQPSLIHLTFP